MPSLGLSILDVVDERTGGLGRPALEKFAGAWLACFLVMARGNVVMKGYLKNPKTTAEAFAGGWFHTGDIGSLDEDGLFYFRCRMAERIRVRGEMVSGFEVEEGALSHQGIEDAAAIGVPAALGEEDIRLFVTLKPGAGLTEEDIRAHCRSVMAKFMVPAIVTILEEMPRTVTGKPEKGKLAALSV